MGKLTGFLDYQREDNLEIEPLERIENFNEFHIPMSKKARSDQAARCMDCGIPFCQYGELINGMTAGCPLYNLIPEFNEHIFNNNYKEALNRLLKTNNFPEFTGRVCPAPCEASCTCGLNGKPVSAKENEFAIIEEAFEKGYIKPYVVKNRLDHKIAIVGSGPSGLATADTLNKRGYQVTVFEKEDRVGGLMMYGIPNMKLEKDIIHRRIDLMKEEGVKFVCNYPVETKEIADKLLNDFDRVVLACGANLPRDVIAENRDANNIYFAVDYLTRVTKSLLDSELKNLNFIETKDKDVVIIGGGDTGNDCVGTSIRLGCKSVTQIEMMPQSPVERAANNPWPTWPRILKVDYGQQEAIATFGIDPRIYETTVNKFIKNEKGDLTAVEIIQIKFVNKDGRRVIEKIEESKKTIKADIVLIAAGFVGTKKAVVDSFGLSLSPRNCVIANEDYKTSNEKVYVTGDMFTGQSLVVKAIHLGREVAKSIDISFMGYTNI
jgi:glutamate synthase (NADPH/NADH) small chain